MKKTDVLVVGSGLGSLTAAALLASKGLKVTVVESNWQAGGCASAYWRKGFVFEAGATTLVGLGNDVPLQFVLDQLGIDLKPRYLTLPMQVHLSTGLTVNRCENLEQWIAEAERVFGKEGQRSFWTEAFQISRFVWKNSLKQKRFPPSNLKDMVNAAGNLSFSQLRHLPYAFMSTKKLLERHKLAGNPVFRDFVNEQLLISAQNHMEEVNALFGATALCYTNYPNYYLDGGLINLVRPLVEFIEKNGGELVLREAVQAVKQNGSGYHISTRQGSSYKSEYVISGLPLNNTQGLFGEASPGGHSERVMESPQLNGAFQMGIGFRPHRQFDTIHHQVHLSEPLPGTDSNSIFISLSHPEDRSRSDVEGLAVMSVSTHVPDPEKRMIDEKITSQAVIQVLEKHDFLRRENIIYQHASTPGSWSKWTGRQWGFVGGYPQYMHIKPWQMPDARFDRHKAYMVGDTVYPGQGIPGVTLSGIIAVEKMSADWNL